MTAIPAYVGYFYYVGIALSFLTPIVFATMYFEKEEAK